MQVELWQIDKPIPYSRNARTIPAQAVEKVAASIREFGFRQPIVVDLEGFVVVGHARLLAARKLGLAEVPVHVADNLTPAQIKAYRLMDNRSHQETDWDNELLSVELADLQSLAVDLSLTGFDDTEIESLLAAGAAPDLEDDDTPPEPHENPVTVTGDLWAIGDHRLLCADCRDPDAVARLFAGKRANIVVTSPPYASQRKYDESSGFPRSRRTYPDCAGARRFVLSQHQRAL